MMPADYSRPRRVILGLGAGGDMVLAIEAATALAATIGTELLCLMVEQEDLINLAGLPFAQAYGPGGAVSTITARGLEAHFDRMFKVAERALAEACARTNVNWQARRPQGETLHQITASLEQGDAAVLNLRELRGGGHAVFGAVRRLLSVATAVVLVPSAKRSAGAVVAIGDGPAAAVAIAIAEEIGTRMGVRVEVVSAPEFELFHRPIATVVTSLKTVERMGEDEFLNRLTGTGAMVVLVAGRLTEPERRLR
ncbi:MAG: hypothetical protein HY245_15875 [Rhizobiales bacterium]|nr:hypothetical protein [Hyphomicrobiales bacterium]MBI3674862.1 hypothetical protein [Hyphomicrobiales bacterium]